MPWILKRGHPGTKKALKLLDATARFGAEYRAKFASQYTALEELNHSSQDRAMEG